VSFHELLLGESLSRDIVDDVTVTAPPDFRVMGKNSQRTDAVDRVTGAQFTHRTSGVRACCLRES
jgi:hypothetical protein